MSDLRPYGPAALAGAKQSTGGGGRGARRAWPSSGRAVLRVREVTKPQPASQHVGPGWCGARRVEPSRRMGSEEHVKTWTLGFSSHKLNFRPPPALSAAARSGAAASGPGRRGAVRSTRCRRQVRHRRAPDGTGGHRSANCITQFCKNTQKYLS